ncbi:hypothetical protein E2562_028441 [Oryza meyeriana var. granulata]|uniref:DNA topoisomerase (ATP-hydrolyzing) n=1 Tax=Oryza meyeriana var. granulata TaxID=110450 RepID=A0A6G1E3K2_9ORYZ|nr:hypothetical protein E2562_028441 [Oryza meyeriana var. granulata]
MESPPLLEQILLRPDDYISLVEKHTQTLWVYESFPMMRCAVTYGPGPLRRDPRLCHRKQATRPLWTPFMSRSTFLSAKSPCTTMFEGIPVELHQEEGIYVLEMIFAHLINTTNYEGNNFKETTGVKLANVFSTEFIIETADGHRLKKYEQVTNIDVMKVKDPQQ